MEILDTGFDMGAYEMKKHMFTVTTMTPKLCDALQVVEAMFEEDGRHCWTSYLAAYVLNTCIHCVQATIKEASHALNIPVKILYRCDALYAVQDAVMKTSNRKEDVSQWSLAFALAIYEEKRGFADQVIPMYRICRDTHDGLPMFTTDELIPFFRMYADKIDEWLNEVFPEESEASNWSDKNTEYHDIFKVLSGLNNLAERLEHLG